MENVTIKWWHGAVIVLLSVAIAALFSAFLRADFSSIDIFAPIEKKVDFQVSDIYNMLEEDKPERELSNSVIVVSIDGLKREQLIDLIDTIRLYEPKAIGLDIYFSIPKADNSRLLQVVANTPEMVSISQVHKDTDELHYVEKFLSFYDDTLTPPHRGYANLDINHSWTVVRTFLPYVRSREGRIIPALSLELAKIAAPERAQQLMERGNTEEIIDFTHREIEVLAAKRLKNPDVAKRLKGKVVLIGVINDTKDIYLTPLKEPTPGVLIHAYATQTIITGQYIRTREPWLNWTIAVTFCFLLVSLLLFASEKKEIGTALNLIIRIVVFLSVLIFVFLGCWVFSARHMYVDYTPSLLMLTFGTMAFDIVYAVYGLFRPFIKE